MKQTTQHTRTVLWGLLLLGGVSMHTSCGAQMSEYKGQPSAGINGGFENTLDNLPVNWYLYTPQTVKEGDFTIEMGTQDAAEGNQSLVFTVKECSAKGGRYSPGFCNEFDVKSGGRYRIRFKVKNEGALVVVKINGVSAKHVGKGIEERISSKEGVWQEVSYEYEIPGEFARIRFELNILSAGKVKVDAFSLEAITTQP